MKRLLSIPIILIWFLCCGFSQGQQKPLFGTPVNKADPWSQGMKLHYAMNEMSGNIINDGSGNGNHGRLVAMTSPWQGGSRGGALSFDLTSQNALTVSGQNIGMGPGSWTWSALVNWRSNTNIGIYGGRLWTTADATATQYWEIYFDKDTQGLRISHNGAAEVVFSTKTVTLKKWTNITVTFNGTTVVGYINSDIAGYAARSPVTVPMNSATMGYVSTAARPLDALVDHISIHNRALRTEEISGIYQEQSAIYKTSVARRPWMNVERNR